MSVRIDKVIWFVRLAKTRSIATELIKKGKVRLNGEQVKPSREVKIGDVLQLVKNTALFEFKLLDLLDRRINAKIVSNYLLDITKPEELERFKQYQTTQSSYREYGTGKPDKHDRKEIDDFLNEIDLWEED